MDISLEWNIVVVRRKFTSEYRMVGEEEKDRNHHGGTRDGLHEKQKHGRRYGRR